LIARATRAWLPGRLIYVPALSRSQIAVYGAVAVALLLVGARAIRAEGDSRPFEGAGAGQPSYGEAAGGQGEDAGGAGGSEGFSLDSGGVDVVVDVTGAVRQPGVYRMPAGARVTDAVERAGGPAGDAELEAINLAARLADGQQVLVPRQGAAGGAAAAGDAGPISLGSATPEQLEAIDGIGPVTAQKIVEYRDQHGGLSSVEQLDEMSGIGPATMESLRSRLQP
jgi:competence protein ComEA